MRSLPSTCISLNGYIEFIVFCWLVYLKIGKEFDMTSSNDNWNFLASRYNVTKNLTKLSYYSSIIWSWWITSYDYWIGGGIIGYCTGTGSEVTCTKSEINYSNLLMFSSLLRRSFFKISFYSFQETTSREIMEFNSSALSCALTVDRSLHSLTKHSKDHYY